MTVVTSTIMSQYPITIDGFKGSVVVTSEPVPEDKDWYGMCHELHIPGFEVSKCWANSQAIVLARFRKHVRNITHLRRFKQMVAHQAKLVDVTRFYIDVKGTTISHSLVAMRTYLEDHAFNHNAIFHYKEVMIIISPLFKHVIGQAHKPNVIRRIERLFQLVRRELEEKRGIDWLKGQLILDYGGIGDRDMVRRSLETFEKNRSWKRAV